MCVAMHSPVLAADNARRLPIAIGRCRGYVNPRKEMEMLVNGKQGFDHYHAAKRQESRTWRKEILTAY